MHGALWLIAAQGAKQLDKIWRGTEPRLLTASKCGATSDQCIPNEPRKWTNLRRARLIIMLILAASR